MRLREQAAVALDLVRARGRPPWGCLVYRHAPRTNASATMDYLLDLLQGLGIAAAIGIRPFLPTLLAGALAAADVGLDFDGTDFSFLEDDRIPARDRHPGGRLRLHRPPPPRRHERPGPLDRRCWRDRARARRAVAVGLDRRPQRRLVAGRTVGRRRGLARLRRPPARCSAASARAWTPRPRARCRSTPRASALLAAGLSILLPAAGHPRRRGARLAADRRPPPAGREVRGPADLGEGEPRPRARLADREQEARPRRHRRDEARDARAGDRDRPRADAAAADRARAAVDDCVAAFPSVTPVCAASIATGTRAGRARDPGDELVASRRGALRRVRHELRRVARLRHPPVADGHDLQHEPRAPLARTSRRCSSRSTTPTSAPPARRT